MCNTLEMFRATGQGKLVPSGLSPSQLVVWPCTSGEFLGMKKEITMEPLVGHLRHPYGLQGCLQDGKQVCFQTSGLQRKDRAQPIVIS